MASLIVNENTSFFDGKISSLDDLEETFGKIINLQAVLNFINQSEPLLNNNKEFYDLIKILNKLKLSVTSNIELLQEKVKAI